MKYAEEYAKSQISLGDFMILPELEQNAIKPQKERGISLNSDNRKKDWTGNMKGVFKMLGASNRTEAERQVNDFYATESRAIEVLMDVETFNQNIWEAACGQGHLSEAMLKRGYNVKSTDLIYRGYGEGGVDFFKQTEVWDGDIITNPPYKYITEWAYKGLSLIPTGNRLALFLKLQHLEGQARKKLFLEHPPKYIYVSSSRLLCAKNADFKTTIDSGGSAQAYGWYVWVKGSATETIVRWIN